MATKIIAKRNYHGIRIYINDILHLVILIKNYNGIQSWYEGDKKRIYYIEVSFKEGEPILIEYSDFDNWKTILKLIDNNL